MAREGTNNNKDVSFVNTVSVLDEVSDQLMTEVKRSSAECGQLSDDLLSCLHFVFHGPLLSALELVEKGSVTRVTCPSKRELFQVIGASGSPYTCFPNLRYCSCPAYRFSVLRKEDHLMCKHVLAVKLAEAMGCCKLLEVSDAEISTMIMDMD